MDELVERLMSLTPIVSQVIKRTGLSMEQLDQMVRITPCVVVDDDGELYCQLKIYEDIKKLRRVKRQDVRIIAYNPRYYKK